MPRSLCRQKVAVINHPLMRPRHLQSGPRWAILDARLAQNEGWLQSHFGY